MLLMLLTLFIYFGLGLGLGVGVRVWGCTRPKTVGRVYSDCQLTHTAGLVRQLAIAIHTAGRVYSTVHYVVRIGAYSLNNLRLR